MTDIAPDKHHHPNSFDHPCWQHAWLHAEGGWDAYGIWLKARWRPLSPLERLEFALHVGGYPDHLDWVVRRNHGRVELNRLLDVHAYTNDPEVPTDMKQPHVTIADVPF